MQQQSNYSVFLHRLAVMTAIAVFPLIIVGAGVTSLDAGMAFPDWPTSNGHLVNPPQWWQNSDMRWEHGHRLIGWVVGMLATLLLIFSWRRGGTLRVLGLMTFLAICTQGVLGGFRVREISRTLAMVHGIFGQLCFCLAAVTAFVSSRSWLERKAAHEIAAAGFLRRLGWFVTVAVFIQLVFGAAYRHFGGDHALFAHLGWAVVTLLSVGWLATWAAGLPEQLETVAKLGKLLGVLAMVQLLLGGGAFVLAIGAGAQAGAVTWLIPSAHVAVGALLFVCVILVTISVRRFVAADPMADDSSGRTRLAVS
jgi:cytochrome c oxidase assembly protein subunit 15